MLKGFQSSPILLQPIAFFSLYLELNTGIVF